MRPAGYGAMALLGERWALVVLGEAFLGVRRFEEFRARTGAPRQVLANRLAALVEQGILRRTPYQEPGQRTRYEYRLTDKGFDLYPALLALTGWAQRHAPTAAGDGEQGVVPVHRGCGAQVSVGLRCAAGHDLASPRQVISRPGPG